MAIKTIIENGETTYVGVLNVVETEAGHREVARSTSRDLVVARLRMAYVERLEKLALDGALLVQLWKSEIDNENPILRKALDELVARIASEAWHLRNDDPALSLCGDLVDPEGYELAVASGGTIDASDWESSNKVLWREMMAAGRCGAR